jgi:hypothetical protein
LRNVSNIDVTGAWSSTKEGEEKQVSFCNMHARNEMELHYED